MVIDYDCVLEVVKANNSLRDAPSELRGSALFDVR